MQSNRVSYTAPHYMYKNYTCIQTITYGLLVCVVSFLPLFALAHVQPIGTINSELRIKDNRIDLYTILSQNVNISGYPIEDERELYEEHFKWNFLITQNGAPCPFELTYFDPSLTAPKSTFRGFFTCPQPIDLNQITMNVVIFSDQFSTFDHFASVFFKGERYQILFNQNYDNYPEELIAKDMGPAPEEVSPSIKNLDVSNATKEEVPDK